MDDYMSEKEQVEEIKRWWSENGRFIIAGLVIGFAVLFGWRAWNDYRETKLMQASQVYANLIEAADAADLELAEGVTTQLTEAYANTPYAVQARLMLAKLYIAAARAEDAAGQLERVIEESRDKQLAEVARLRLARVRLYQERAQQALDILAAASPGKLAAQVHELRGDILLAMQDVAGARREYQLALEQHEPGLGDPQLIQMKLENLATDDDAERADGEA